MSRIPVVSTVDLGNGVRRGRAETELEMKRFLFVALAMLVVGAPMVVAAPPGKAAPDLLDQSYYQPIQPGAPVKIYPSDAYPAVVRDSPFGVCTLNFVFRGRELGRPTEAHPAKVHTYIGDAGHCLRSVGQRVAAPGVGEFGTVAFRLSCRLEPKDETCDGRPREDDFGLIRVDEDKLHLVSPIMRGLGKPPTGFTTSNETATGDLLLAHGQGAPYTLVEPGRTQVGVLEDDTSRGFGSTLQGNLHSGSPVVRLSDGKALGIYAVPKSPSVLQATGGVPGSEVLLGGPTVEHILDLLAEARFRVQLVTAAA